MIIHRILVLLALAATLGASPANGQLYTPRSPFLKAAQTQANLEPVIAHPDQQRDAEGKLAAAERKFGRRPNILFIVVDDMGWGDPGVYGGGAAVGAPTANIDALAHGGLMLTSTYSQPSCTPTRAAFLTGRLPQRTGLTRPTAAGERMRGMAGEVTVAELLRSRGYATGMAGKWHLGEERGQWPTDSGFDEYYGNLGVNTVYHDWRDPEISPEIVYKPERFEIMSNKVQFVRTTVMLKRGDTQLTVGEEINLKTEPFLEEKYLRWSQDFMKRAVAANKPFFVYHSMNRVHTKNYPNPMFRGKSPAGTPFKDSVLEVDWVVGELVKTLKETGQLDNTLVVFTSDNGPEEDVMAGGIFTTDSGHTPFRGAKGTTWEGGVRVPGIVSWPGTIKAGRVSDGLFDLMDVFNTFARLGGVTQDALPKDRFIDGIDQTSFLIADNGESNREGVFYWYGQQFYGARFGEFKVMERLMTVGMNPGPSTYGGLFNSQINELTDPEIGVLFNLYMDPKERIPGARTWVIAPMLEMRIRHKASFKRYPQIPRGVYIDGALVGGGPGIATAPSRD